MEADYRRYVQQINQLEKQSSSANSSGPQLREAYNGLLTRFPLLEGFWIRRAHTEFRLTNSADAAIAVYEKALQTCNLNYSLAIWTSYLQFLIRIANFEAEGLQKKFHLASKLVGNHFLSHEFWDLYLEIHESPVGLLLYVLDHLTIHQFSKYYAQLIAILEQGDHTEEFRDVMPTELQETKINKEELPQIHQVIMSRLKLKYELHSRRVKQALKFEQQIRRPFFYPRAPPDTANWRSYLEAGVDTLSVFHRALIPCAEDSRIWIAYIRYHHSQNLSVDDISAAYRVPVALKLVPVMLHYALWLELNGEADQAAKVYEEAEKTGSDRAAVATQYAQFLARQSKAESAREKLHKALETDPKNTRLASELAALEPTEPPRSAAPPAIRTVEDIITEFG